MNDRARQFVRSLGAATALVLVVVAVPMALWRAVGNPLPANVPAWNDIKQAIGGDQSVSDMFWIDLIAVLVWIAWARLTIGVAFEIAATIRHRPQPLTSSRTQEWIAKTVATAVLLLTLSHQRITAPAPLPRLVAAVSPAPAPDITYSANVVPTRTAAPVAAKSWTVQRHESLWRIAERCLGDGRRYTDIYGLNRGRPQPDGDSLTDPSIIRTGWILQLPDNAVLPAPGDASVTVEPGDTLSSIAQRELGDAYQWPTLASINAGVVQPDGLGLTDPNLIQPGWHIALAAPDDTDPAAQPAPPNAAPAPVTPSTASVSDAPELPPAEASPPTVTTSVGSATSLAAANPRPANGDSVDPLRVAEWIGLPSITAAVVVHALRRRRRMQLAYRTSGTAARVATAGGGETVERQVRAIADEEAVRWIDATTRLLTLAIRNDPKVRPLLLRTGTQGVEILLETPRSPLEPWFNTEDSGRTWRLRPDHELDDLLPRVADEPAATPALVTIGTTPEGPVLANLELFGTLSVTGDPDRTHAFLNSIAVELANAPWSAPTSVHADESLPASAIEQAAPVPTGHANEVVRTHLNATQTALPDDCDALIVRAREGESELWTPTVVLTEEQLEAELIQDIVPARGVVAIVATTAPTGAPWRLHIEPDGSAHLRPLDFSIDVAAGLNTDQLRSVTSLLTDELTTSNAADVSARSSLGGTDIEVESPIESTGPSIEQIIAPKPVEVRVLGPTPVVHGWQSDDKVRPKSTEVIVRLALTDQPVRTDRLWNDLWPKGCEYGTFKNAVARTRTMLGIDSTGQRHLREAVEGTYRLGDEVGCDWTRFQTLVHAARRAADDDGRDYLRAALSLVTGQPFSNTPRGDYGWAEVDGTTHAIEVAITDAAHRLGELALARGDAVLASWAAAQGHLGTPEQLQLFETEILARGLAGDIDGISRAYNAAQHAVHRLEILDTVPASIVDAYEKAMRTAHSERAAS